jgi:hypothetical protein
LFVAKCPAPCNLPILTLDAAGRVAPTVPKPFVVRRIFLAPQGSTVDNVFPVIAIDRVGGVHVAFSDKKDIYLTSSSDGGETWLPPVRVNDGAETATALFPWIFAGDSGRVGIMWYGTDRVGNADSEQQFSGAEWKIFYAFTPNAFATSPTFTQVVASGWNNVAASDPRNRGVVHIGSICTQGLACDLATPRGNRNLAEYSSNTMDPLGLANIAYAGDVITPNGRARTHFTRQIGGPTGLLRPIVTGGGFIGSSASEKNFGFNVQGDLAGPWSGHVNYLDKIADLHLKADTFTSVLVQGNRVTFSGRGSVQTAAGTSQVTFTIVATDNGEPGTGNDTFSITLSTGYSASGTLGGGNIKQH